MYVLFIAVDEITKFVHHRDYELVGYRFVIRLTGDHIPYSYGVVRSELPFVLLGFQGIVRYYGMQLLDEIRRELPV